MKIAVVTVYHPFTNLGSFLQAYAINCVLSNMGHEVKFVKTGPHIMSALKLMTRINPKREFFLRFVKALNAMRDLSKLEFVSSDIAKTEADIIVFGSDEIWNVTNKFFQQPVFWGMTFENQPKICYAVSAGHARLEDFLSVSSLTSNIINFDNVFTRDTHTKTILEEQFHIESELVIDPTLLIDVSQLSQPIVIPERNYLLVYSYGLNPPMISIVKEFARRNNLKIISPCFWHHWADKVINCSALQFSTLIKNARYVFTTTFHGAIFSLVNHSQCCILPAREKVRSLCITLNSENRLINEDISLEQFEEIINQPFHVDHFEKNVLSLRTKSMKLLTKAIDSKRK